jgi:hypothetical protein
VLLEGEVGDAGGRGSGTDDGGRCLAARIFVLVTRPPLTPLPPPPPPCGSGTS